MKGEVIWPLSIRLIHWVMAIAITLDAFWLEDATHENVGYLAAGLVLIRFGYGIFGRGTPHFSSLPLKPKQFVFFFKNHFKGQCHYEAHNPLASLVYLLMWGLVLALGVTGWMMGLDAYWGDETLEAIHTQLSNALLGLVVIHLIGLTLDSLIYRRKSWMVMLDGKKR